MATLDDELLMDEQENRREVAFIREQLPSELKARYTDKQLLWMIDAIVDYYFESGILESADDEVDIDMEQVAAHLCQQAQQELGASFDAGEVFFVVQADLDFQEQNL